jgi:diadenosine tetraphosphate (Ap4A) HIT family hydrolase
MPGYGKEDDAAGIGQAQETMMPPCKKLSFSVSRNKNKNHDDKENHIHVHVLPRCLDGKGSKSVSGR